MLKVTINDYIKKIKAQEALKVAADPTYQPRHIPKTQEIAEASGYSLAHYYKFIGKHAEITDKYAPKIKNINRFMPGNVMRYLRSLGYDTEIWDILTEDGEDGC